MAHQNVELVHRACGLIEELQAAGPGPGADPEVLDRAFRDHLDEGFEVCPPAIYPEGAQVFRGREGLKQWVAMTKEVWGEWRFEPERFLYWGKQVVALVRVVAEGGLSGVRLDRETAHLWTVRGDRLRRCEVYLDRSEALGAVRSEQRCAS